MAFLWLWLIDNGSIFCSIAPGLEALNTKHFAGKYIRMWRQFLFPKKVKLSVGNVFHICERGKFSYLYISWLVRKMSYVVGLANIQMKIKLICKLIYCNILKKLLCLKSLMRETYPSLSYLGLLLVALSKNKFSSNFRF